VVDRVEVDLLGVFQLIEKYFGEIEIALLSWVSDDEFELSHE